MEREKKREKEREKEKERERGGGATNVVTSTSATLGAALESHFSRDPAGPYAMASGERAP
jgi:hypothetical protein